MCSDIISQFLKDLLLYLLQLVQALRYDEHAIVDDASPTDANKENEVEDDNIEKSEENIIGKCNRFLLWASSCCRSTGHTRTCSKLMV